MPTQSACRHRFGTTLVLAFLLSLPMSAAAQAMPTAPTATQQPQDAVPPADPDAEIVGSTPQPPRTPAQTQEAAWAILTQAAGDERHTDTRIEALAALALLSGTPRAHQFIEKGMQDQDLDVRTAAVLAAGETRSPALTSAMRRLLDDREPQVAFAAALSLWKMGDRSGEDILMAVIDGERRASANLIHGTEHTVSHDLHSPATLAKIGAMQASGMLLGPFGFGITAYEYIRKNGGDSARVHAIDAIAQEHTEPVRKELIAALTDKDPSVRAAAAKALDSDRRPETSAAIAKLFDDPKPPVRYTAAAAYLVSTTGRNAEHTGSQSRRPAAQGQRTQ